MMGDGGEGAGEGWVRTCKHIDAATQRSKSLGWGVDVG